MLISRTLCLITAALAILLNHCFVCLSQAEIKVFEKEVKEVVSRDRSQDQMEEYALQKAKRLALEEAGSYVSSLSIVQNYRLTTYEIIAVASAAVRAKPISDPVLRLEDGVLYVTVKARIEIDTSVLDRQIEALTSDKGTLKERHEALIKMRELENQLSNMKGSEIKRLKEIRDHALALDKKIYAVPNVNQSIPPVSQDCEDRIRSAVEFYKSGDTPAALNNFEIACNICFGKRKEITCNICDAILLNERIDTLIDKL